jgi:hypothetical protein
MNSEARQAAPRRQALFWRQEKWRCLAEIDRDANRCVGIGGCSSTFEGMRSQRRESDVIGERRCQGRHRGPGREREAAEGEEGLPGRGTRSFEHFWTKGL